MHATSASALPTGTAAPPGASADFAERRRLRHELRQAAEQGAFTLSFQPRRTLQGGHSIGAQVQPTWPRRRGVATPAAFNQLVDHCGLAPMVAAWLLAASCNAATQWPTEPGKMQIPDPLQGTVIVGVPGWSLEDGSLLEHVGAALTGSGLAPERLEIVVAEGSFTRDPSGGAAIAPEAVLALAALRDVGIGVGLEFGRHTVDLLSLHRLPLTSLTLDRALIRDLPANRDAAALVHAIVATAHQLGIQVVASGLEAEAQRTFLSNIGCDAGQGPLFNRAATAGRRPSGLEPHAPALQSATA